jgi:hypothetical protein
LKPLLEIRRQLMAGEFEFSGHAFRRVVERNISEQEIRDAGAQAEVIEDHPQDKYSPSALLLGFRECLNLPPKVIAKGGSTPLHNEFGWLCRSGINAALHKLRHCCDLARLDDRCIFKYRSGTRI